MGVYVMELIVPTVLNVKDTVSFILNTGECIRYNVSVWFLNGLNTGNDGIFKALGIKNKEKFVEDIVGYTVSGWFPSVRSVEDLDKVIKVLANYNKPNSYTATAEKIKNKKEEKFTLSVKKHKQTKLNYKL